MSRMIMIVIVFAIILILYMGPGRAPKDPKPATQHASQPTVVAPGSGFGDGLQQTLDQKYLLGMQFRFEAQLSALRLALANPLDAQGATSVLTDQDQLVKDLKDARASLLAGGTTVPAYNDWLAKSAWPECRKLADQLRHQVADQAAQNPSEGTPDK